MRNKRGGFDIFTLFVVVLVIIALAVVQNGGSADDVARSLDKDTLNWDKLYQNVSISIDNAFADQEPWMQSIGEIIKKGVDLAGFTIIEVAKLAANFAASHPDIINYKTLIILFILSLFAPLIYPIFIIVVSLILIIREWWMNKEDKKRLEALRNE